VFPPAVLSSAGQAISTVAALVDIPEEDIWLAKQKSKRTRRAYKQDVQHFMRTITIRSYEELRTVDHRAVIAWERIMREIDGAAASTVRRRLAALSSIFKHLVRYGYAEKNPVAEIERPAINRREGSTLAFSKADARKLLDRPDEKTLKGLRDRAILAVGMQVGLRRAEIASLTVEDLHQNRRYDSLRITRKGGRHDALAVHPNAAMRLEAYMEAAGHADDSDGPLFRPLSHNRKKQEQRRHMDPDAIDRVLRKYAKAIGIARGYSAHSMRATFITTALENGCSLEDVQRAAGHSEPAPPSSMTDAVTIRKSRRASSPRINASTHFRLL
jgi:integrase/recombinase XerD